MRAPQAISLLAQLLLIDLADLLQNLAQAIQVGDLSAHLDKLIGMEGDLTGFGAGIIHIQDPLVMAFATGAGGAGDICGMKGVTFEQRAAQQIVKRRELGEQLASGTRMRRALFTSHLYRCYTSK